MLTSQQTGHTHKSSMQVALVARRAEALEPVEQEIKAAGGTAQSFPADTGWKPCPFNP